MVDNSTDFCTGPGLIAMNTGMGIPTLYTATMYSRELSLSDAMFLRFTLLLRGEIQLIIANSTEDVVVWTAHASEKDWQSHCVNITGAVQGIPQGPHQTVPQDMGQTIPQGPVRLRLECTTSITSIYALAAAITNITIGYGTCAPALAGLFQL